MEASDERDVSGGVKRALILAAGKGSRLLPETADRPKCLIDLAGRSILQRLLEVLLEVGVSEWVIVTGYLEDQLRDTVEGWDLSADITWCRNPDFAHTNTLYSVHLGAEHVADRDFLLLNGDLWLESSELARLVADPGARMLVDTVSPLDAEAMKVQLDQGGLIHAIAKTLDIERSIGEAIGAYLFDPQRGGHFLERVARLSTTDEGRARFYYEAALHALMQEEGWRAALVQATPGCWAEIDDLDDLGRARRALR